MSGLYHGSVVIAGWLLKGGMVVEYRYVFMRGRNREIACPVENVDDSSRHTSSFGKRSRGLNEGEDHDECIYWKCWSP